MPPKGVLKQHQERMRDDEAYREAALTPPGNHPVGGHVDGPQLTADGEPAAKLSTTNIGPSADKVDLKPADDAKPSAAKSSSKSSS